MELLDFIFKSFWHFLGCLIILTGIGDFILLMWQTIWKYKK